MLNARKITTRVFPKLMDLPKEIVEHYGHKESDGMIIFSPPERFRKEKATYFCTRCGTKGETAEEFPVCTNCGNTAFRPPINDGRYTDSCRNVRYVQQIEEYVVIREFDCFPKESAETGITTEANECFRIVLSESDYGLYGQTHRYVKGEGSQKVWASTREIFDNRNRPINLVVEDPCVYDNFLMTKLADALTRNIDELTDRVKLAAVGMADEKGSMPEVAFAPWETSAITGVQERWDVEVRTQEVENSDSYVRILSWCTNCGKFGTRLSENERSYGSEGCKYCGKRNSYHQRDKEYIFHLIDAAETDDDGIVIRVQAMIRDRVFAKQVVEGEDPVVETKDVPQFTNYIHVNNEGKVRFYDDNRKEITKLQIQIYTYHTDRHRRFIFEEKSLELLKTHKCIKRTGYDLLLNTQTTPKYFEYLKEIPSMEIFAKSQMFILINDIMQKNISDLPAFIRGTSKQKSLKNLTKPQLESLRNQFVTLKHLDAYLQCLGKDPTALYEDFMSLSTTSHERHVLDILRVGVPGLTVKKICEYIQRVDDMQCCAPKDSMQLWADYLRMLRDSECDLTDTKLVYTHSLKREHDKVARKMTQINDEKLIAAFEQKANDNEWLEFKGRQLSAVVPHQLTDLYEEGRKLSHCVGSYARSVIDGSSVIVFLRRNTNLDVPYCTVEVRDKTIVQVRGWNNREGRAIPDIRSFLKNWSEEKGLILDVA